MRKIQPSVRAYLQTTFVIPAEERENAVTRFFLPARQRFLDRVEGAVVIDWLARREDVQILAGFDTVEHAVAYLESPAARELAGHLRSVAESQPDSKLYLVD